MRAFHHAWQGLSRVVIGVDGYRGGWVGVVLGRASSAVVTGPTVAAVVEEAAAVVPASVDVVAVDIPIGLCEHGWRACDVAGRRALGRRASTLFLTPPRAVLEAPTYAEAGALSRALTGAGVSTQAYGLRRRVLEVDEWVRSGPGVTVCEVHPELSFARMAGRVVTSRKHDADGLVERRALLAAEGVIVPAVVPGVPTADVLDAAACAWTARRMAAGVAGRMGDGPAIHT